MPESSEERQLPAEGFGKLLDVSSTINVMIKFVFQKGGSGGHGKVGQKVY